MKRKIGFAVAGVMATLGALLVFLYLKDNRNSATAAPTAAPIESEFTDDTEEPTDDSTPEVVDDPLSGDPVEAENGSLVAITDDNRILETGDPVRVPPDYLQVTFTVPADRALGGRVRPGDNVAVIVSFASDPAAAENAPSDGAVDEAGDSLTAGLPAQTTDVLLHKALVADVQVQDVLGATTTTSGMGVDVLEGALNSTNTQIYTISLALPSTQVERLVYALEYGSIWLAHQPSDAGETTNGIVSIDNIHQEVSIFIDPDDLTSLASDDGEASADDETPADLAFNFGSGDDASADDGS